MPRAHRLERLLPFSRAAYAIVRGLNGGSLYYRVKDKRLLPPAVSGYLQLTIYPSNAAEGCVFLSDAIVRVYA